MIMKESSTFIYSSLIKETKSKLLILMLSEVKLSSVVVQNGKNINKKRIGYLFFIIFEYLNYKISIFFTQFI